MQIWKAGTHWVIKLSTSIISTTNKPDTLIDDHSCKAIIFAELTFPFETNISKKPFVAEWFVFLNAKNMYILV